LRMAGASVARISQRVGAKRRHGLRDMRWLTLALGLLRHRRAPAQPGTGWIVTGRSSKSSSARRARNASGVKRSVWITRHGVWPRCWSIDRSEDGQDLGFGLRRDVVGMVGIPNVGVSGVGNDVAMRRRDLRIA
jgi:hypothetical protein